MPRFMQMEIHCSQKANCKHKSFPRKSEPFYCHK